MKICKYTFLILAFWVCLLLPSYRLCAQKVQVIKFDSLQTLFQKNDDTLYVVNFWATWCLPCVKELPDFEQINAIYKNQKFKMILASLDFKPELHLLQKFVIQKKLSALVVLLDEPKYHEWIDKVNKDWGGAIPATIFSKNNKTELFLDQTIHFDQLKTIVDKLISN
jgi:thiol-disulfide isomerase/thioredoxin